MHWFDSEEDPAERSPTGPPAPFTPAGTAEDRGTDPAGGAVARPPRPRLPPELADLQPFVEQGTTDLLINGGDELWVDSGVGLLRAAGWSPLDEEAVRSLAVDLIEAGGRHLDNASPCVDVTLSGGVRVHAVLPPVSSRGAVISVRIPAAAGWSLGQLVEAGMADQRQGELLRALVGSRSNVLISGAAGCGKTTLLAALMGEVPGTERIVTIEDVPELRVEHPHVVGLAARQANVEGAGEIGLARLVREALRMRPDRLVVGECRGAEVRELLMALATGHDGGAGTVHARSLDEVPTRLETLGGLAGLDPPTLARLAASAIDAVVHLERTDGVRRIAAIGRLRLDRGGMALERLD